jgi:hypothetical protein
MTARSVRRRLTKSVVWFALVVFATAAAVTAAWTDNSSAARLVAGLAWLVCIAGATCNALSPSPATSEELFDRQDHASDDEDDQD